MRASRIPRSLRGSSLSSASEKLDVFQVALKAPASIQVGSGTVSR